MRKTIFLAAAFIFFSLGAGMSETMTRQAFAADTQPDNQNIHIIRGADMSSYPAVSEYFTGNAHVDGLFPRGDRLGTSGGYVHFAPGARTNWHTHPAGQLLIITAGSGRVQQWGKPMQEVAQGDVVWFPAGVKHWHGATPNISMSHIAMAEYVDGKAVEWMEAVTDEQYGK